MAATATSPSLFDVIGDSIKQWAGLGESAEGQARQKQAREQMDALRNRIVTNPKSNFLDQVNALSDLQRQSSALSQDESRSRMRTTAESAGLMLPIKKDLNNNETDNKIRFEDAQARGDLTRLQGTGGLYKELLGVSTGHEKDVYGMQQATHLRAIEAQRESEREQMALRNRVLDKGNRVSIKDGIGLALAAASLFV